MKGSMKKSSTFFNGYTAGRNMKVQVSDWQSAGKLLQITRVILLPEARKTLGLNLSWSYLLF